MHYFKQHNWRPLLGKVVQIRKNGKIVRSGVVDAITDDGLILWIAGEGACTRQMAHQHDGYEVWIGYENSVTCFVADGPPRVAGDSYAL